MIITYEFKVDGMTCVACSSAIEKGLTEAFKDHGLVEISVILLMHKMKISFQKSK